MGDAECEEAVSKEKSGMTEAHAVNWKEGDELTLSMMPFLPHTEEMISKLGPFDRLCLNFLKFVVRSKKKAFVCVTGFYVFLMLLGMVSQSLMLSPQYQYAWIINEKRNTLNRDIRLEAIEEVDSMGASSDASREQQYTLLGTWIEYAGGGGAVFTPERLKQICEIESHFYTQSEYAKVCMLDDQGDCVIPALSVLGKFYGYPWLKALVNGGAASSCTLLDESHVEAAWQGMRSAANASVAGFLENGVFMETGSLETGVTTKTRSLLYVGQPLEGYESTTDKTEEQLETYLEYFAAVEEDIWDLFGVESTVLLSAYLEEWEAGGVQFRCFAWLLQRLEWLRMQEMDSVFMLFTILFVTFWVGVHTGSCAYTGAAMAQILMSIPITAFFYRFVFRFEYFAFLHLCSVFFVLGIGADDNFVLLDAWKQSSSDVPAVEDPDETTLRRLLYSFSRALEAIFNTSLTTAVAFLCLGASPLMPVRTFGIFAAMVVIMNYIMVLTMIPTCMLFCEHGCCCCPSKPRAKVAPGPGAPDGASDGAKGQSVFSKLSIEPFFEHVYLPLMKWSPLPGPGGDADKKYPFGALLSALCFTAWGFFMFYCAGQLEMPKDQEEFFPKEHMFSGFLTDMAEDYLVGATSEYCEVYYTFGIDGLGNEDYNEFEPDYKRGFPKWNDDFDLYDADARASLKQSGAGPIWGGLLGSHTSGSRWSMIA